MELTQGYGLRPRTIGELLDLTFRVYRSRIPIFASIGILMTVSSLVPSVVFQALIALMFEDSEGSGMSSSLLLGLAFGIPVLCLVYLALYSFGSMAITSVVDDAWFGRPASLRSALAAGAARTPAAVGTSILCSILTLLGAAACCLPGIAVMIVLVLAVPVVFLERLSLLPAIRRSTELIMRRGPTGFTLEAGWMRTTVIAFVMFIIYYLLIILSQLPLLILNVVAVFRAEPPTQTILGPQLVPLSILLPLQVVCAAIQGVFFAIIVIPWPLLYYDIRTRYEGLDLEAAAAELAASPAALEES